MKYCVKLTRHDGKVSYLAVGDRTQWSKRTAQAHARDMRCEGLRAQYAKVEVEEA